VRELEGLPAAIEALEAEQKTLSERLQDSDLYRDGNDEADAVHARIEEIENEMLAKMERWEALEARK
nr:ABC transporter ATP-binding protein [Pseudomonas sp.]